MNAGDINDNFDIEDVAVAALTGALDKVQKKYLDALGIEITANIQEKIEAISERQVSKLWNLIVYSCSQ